MSRKRFLPTPSAALLPSVQLWRRRSLTGEPDRAVARHDLVAVLNNHAVTAGEAFDASVMDSACEASPAFTRFAKYWPLG